jgi:hypothetical protein
MNRRFFDWYQYLGPLFLTPLSFYLWWKSSNGSMELVFIAWFIPIIYAYIVPGVGTNILKVWEFDTKYKLGKFRIQHGFVFGSATSTLAWLSHISPASTILDVVQTAFIFSSVLGLWNIIYDIKAIKSKILIVYNQPWADGKSEEAIVMDYAPWFFAGFGMIYGLGVGTAELLLSKNMLVGILFYGLLLLTLALTIIVPVVGYRRQSFKVHGHSGCKPINH